MRAPASLTTCLAVSLVTLASGCGEPEDEAGDYVYADALDSLAPLSEARYAHTATTLSDGRVLVIGGTLGSPGTLDIDAYVAEVDLYDPEGRSFTRGAALAVPRAEHRATRLSDDRVVVIGGTTDMGLPGPVAAVEVWDPSSESFSTVAELGPNLIGHCALATSEDQVLVIDNCEPGDCTPLRIDPDSGGVTELGGAPSYRYALDVDCVGLSEGRVILGGGTEDQGGGQVGVAALEIYDPSSESFSVVAEPLAAAFGPEAKLVGLGGDRVLIVGDVVDPGAGVLGQVYDAASGELTQVGGGGSNRVEHRATLLADGRVLISGGRLAGGPNLDFVTALDVYDPASGTLEAVGVSLDPRHGHAAARLHAGPVLLIGGQDDEGRLADVDLFR